MNVFIEQTHCDSHRIYPHRYECFWRTRGAQPIPNLASCTVWGIPRIPLASFPYCNIHQSFSQNSSVASCLLLLPAQPRLLKNFLPTFSPLQIPSPLCALMTSSTSSSLIFSFKQSSCGSNTRLAYSSPPPPR